MGSRELCGAWRTQGAVLTSSKFSSELQLSTKSWALSGAILVGGHPGHGLFSKAQISGDRSVPESEASLVVWLLKST